MKIELKEKFEKQNYALYLPAISVFYTKQLQVRCKEDYDGRVPEKFEKGLAGLNFLHEDGYFYYPFGLYSAGHADLNLEKGTESEAMVHKRDRDKTLIIGDSGGFQLMTGVLKMDWSNAKDPNDKARQEICRKILHWLEETADWSMTLDVPAPAAEPPMNERSGLKCFGDTLEITLLNLDYFIKNRRPGKTKFLNVISGTDANNAKIWYNSVKKYSDKEYVTKELNLSEDHTLEGFAFAGVHARNMYVALTRILDLIKDGLIAEKDWLHILGLGRLDWACFSTAIQRVIQKHYNKNFKISFDAASPFVATAHGQCYNYNSFTSKRFMYAMSPAPDDKTFAGSDLSFPYLSPVTERLTLGDLCPMGREHAIVNGKVRFDINKEEFEKLRNEGKNVTWVEAKAQKNGKIAKTSWDTLSYLLYMSHNVYKHIEAVMEANRVTDIEYERRKPKWQNWVLDKKRSSANEISRHVPHEVLYFRNFVEELLHPENPDPYRMLEENRALIEKISFGNVKGNVFSELFETNDVGEENAIDMYVDLNDEKLIQLEK